MIFDKTEEINLSSFFNIFKRRRKIILVTAISIFSIFFLRTLIQRKFEPVYKGYFLLLVNDPMKANNSRNTNMFEGVSMFEEIARNNTDLDTPTLIELLKSRLLLEPIHKKFNLDPNRLKQRLSIQIVGSKRKMVFDRPKGVLEVSLISKNPKKDLIILEEISQIYLQAALYQRQERLSSGLEFLNSQEPDLRSKASSIQDKIADFRKKNSFLTPIIESESIKNNQRLLEQKLLELKLERERINDVKIGIAEGTLTAIGFQEAIGSNISNANSGLKIADFDQEL